MHVSDWMDFPTDLAPRDVHARTHKLMIRRIRHTFHPVGLSQSFLCSLKMQMLLPYYFSFCMISNIKNPTSSN